MLSSLYNLRDWGVLQVLTVGMSQVLTFELVKEGGNSDQ